MKITSNRIAIISLIISLSISFYFNQPDALKNALWNTGISGRASATEEVRNSVNLYNKVSAGLYSTAGVLEGLAEIPAAPLLKRRLFKDINQLKSDGLIMVFDRDRVSFSSITFWQRNAAIAETDEVWAVSLQDVSSRRPVFNTKAIEVRARYKLFKGSLQGEPEHWIVHDLDVYRVSTSLPPFNRETAL